MVKAKKNKRQARDSNLVMSEEQTTVCSCVECGRIFNEPIELTVRADGSLKTYYACPHCFSRVSISDNLEKGVSEANRSASTKDVKETTQDIEKNKPVGCPHFLGFLKTRPEGSPIPEECLTCASIIQCMGFG